MDETMTDAGQSFQDWLQRRKHRDFRAKFVANFYRLRFHGNGLGCLGAVYFALERDGAGTGRGCEVADYAAGYRVAPRWRHRGNIVVIDTKWYSSVASERLRIT